MEQISCPECGLPLAGNASTCTGCGFPIHNILQPTINTVLEDEGDNNAEDILRKVLNFIKALIIIMSVLGAIIMVIAGIAMMSNPYGGQVQGIILLIVGVLSILFGIGVARLIWAVGMIFINISTNVRTIKKIIKIK